MSLNIRSVTHMTTLGFKGLKGKQYGGETFLSQTGTLFFLSVRM